MFTYTSRKSGFKTSNFKCHRVSKNQKIREFTNLDLTSIVENPFEVPSPASPSLLLGGSHTLKNGFCIGKNLARCSRKLRYPDNRKFSRSAFAGTSIRNNNYKYRLRRKLRGVWENFRSTFGLDFLQPFAYFSHKTIARVNGGKYTNIGVQQFLGMDFIPAIKRRVIVQLDEKFKREFDIHRRRAKQKGWRETW